MESCGKDKQYQKSGLLLCVSVCIGTFHKNIVPLALNSAGSISEMSCAMHRFTLADVQSKKAFSLL